MSGSGRRVSCARLGYFYDRAQKPCVRLQTQDNWNFMKWA